MPEAGGPRVLQVGPDPAIGGGMAAALAALLESPLAERFRFDFVPTYRGPSPIRRVGVFALALARISVWALRDRGRLVHIHATVRGSAYRKAVCVLLARALRRRVVLHVHSGAGDIEIFRKRLRGAKLALVRAGYARSDRVLAVSRASAEALAGAYGLEGVVVTPNPAPAVPEFDRADALDGSIGAAYLGGFANRAKGGDVLLEALGAALRRVPGMRITLAGPGEPPSSADLPDGVSWAGWLGPAEKEDLLRSAQIFVMPSRSEGMPMALLEAMAYGMAIVATEAGGIPELLDDERDGLLVGPDRPEELADALCRLAGDGELRRRLGETARRRARSLDRVEVSARLAELYDSLL